MDRDQAAETLRTIEGMRKRSLAAGKSRSPFPFWVWGGAMAIAAPLTLLPGGHVVPNIVVGVALLAAFAATDLYRRRMPVHASRPRPQRSTLETVVLVVLIVVTAPFLIGVFFTFLFFAAGSIGIFALYTAAAILAGRMLNNDPFAVTAGFSMFGVALGIPISERISDDFFLRDHPWEAFTAGAYALIFLVTGTVVYLLERRRRGLPADRPLPGLALDHMSPTEPQS